ncbi:MAG TPA: NINE protein [Clostridiales bacterium]|nr:NINE protein [Clostridiales bacterium]
MNNKKLTMEELNYVQKEISHKGKSISKTYILTLVLGLLGVHKAYLDKTKSGVVRAFLTLLTAGVLLNINSTMSNISFSAKTAKEVLAQNAILAVVFISLTFIGIIWTLIDLILIPKWIKEIDLKNEAIATEKAVQARYVSEHLLKDQLSKHLIEQVKKEVGVKINEEIEKALNVLQTGDKQKEVYKYKAPLLSEDAMVHKDINQIIEEDLNHKEDNKEYPDHKSQVNIDILKPDEIKEEFEEDIQTISVPLSELVEKSDIDYGVRSLSVN